MACYSGYTKDGSPFFICGDLGSPCAECNDVSEVLCDYPIGGGKTCDRSICHQHSNLVGEDMHYCKAHFGIYKKENPELFSNVIEL